MNKDTRTNNVIKNMWVGTFFHILSLIFGFVSRTIFIKILSEEYLGLNSLFTNILTILSFAELGLGGAIVYTMYKPLATNDVEQLKKITNFLKKTYRIIGIVILGVGLLIMPFIPQIIAKIPDIKENIYLIYVLFLIDTSISYFFTYKTSILLADQKNYIILKYTYLFKISQIIIQLVVLYLTKEYLLYLILQVLNTFITQLFLASKATKMYPFLKELGKKEISKSEKHKIYTNVKALVISRFGGVILDGTDSIIISKYLGLVVLGLYSNYYLLLSAITQILNQIFYAFTSSVGNLIATNGKEKSRKVFKELHYFTSITYSVIAISLYFLFNDFIKLWLGSKYILDDLVVLTIVIQLYINGVQYASSTFRNASGNFKYFKYAPLVSAFINIVVSIVLAKQIGLAGVFIGTIVSRITTATWIDPSVVYKHVFKEKPWEFFFKYFKYLFISILSFGICYYLTKLIVVANIFMFLLKGIVLVITTSLIFILLTFKTEEFKDLKNRISYFFHNRILKRKEV